MSVLNNKRYCWEKILKILIIPFFLFFVIPSSQASIEVSNGLTFVIGNQQFTPAAFTASTISLSQSYYCVDSVCLPYGATSGGSTGTIISTPTPTPTQTVIGGGDKYTPAVLNFPPFISQTKLQELQEQIKKALPNIDNNKILIIGLLAITILFLFILWEPNKK